MVNDESHFTLNYIISKEIIEETMPKQKTKSSAKKRFVLTGTGKIKRKHAFKRHILTKKSNKRKLKLTHDTLVHPHDVASVKEMLMLK